MKLYKYASAAFAFMLIAATGGCSDEKWTPGPQDTEVGADAYFNAPSKTDYIFGSDYDPDDMMIRVDVERLNTAGEAAVPLIFTSDTEGIVCPGTVVFPDGEGTASFSIDCSAIEKGTKFNMTVALADSQTDVYGIGLHELAFTAIKSDWIELSDNVRYLYTDYSTGVPLYPFTDGLLYQLEGTNNFKLTDFFGSGLDIMFECTTGGATVFRPSNNADFDSVYEDDKEDLGWYLYDEANQTWPVWVPGNLEGFPSINYLLFYCVSAYNMCNMIYDASSLYGYIQLTSWVEMSDGTGTWGNFQIDFNLKYNPFE